MRILARILAIPAFLVLAGAAHGEYLIKFYLQDGPSTIRGQAAAFFAEQVGQRLAGTMKVEISPNAGLGEGAAAIAALVKGDGESGAMAALPIRGLVGLSGRLALFDLPFLFDDIKAVHKLLDSQVADKLIAPLEEAGLQGLAFWDDGMDVFSVRGISPLRNPRDVEGKKILTTGSDIDKATITALGGIPQELPAEDVYDALAAGRLDGQENAWSAIVSARSYEVQDWISVSNHAYGGYLVVAGLGFWGRLPQEIRDELSDILGETTRRAREIRAALREEERARVNAAGKAIILGLTSSELEEWRKATAGVAAQHAAGIGEDLIAEAREVLSRVSIEDLAPAATASSQPPRGRSEPAAPQSEGPGAEGSGPGASRPAAPATAGLDSQAAAGEAPPPAGTTPGEPVGED